MIFPLVFVNICIKRELYDRLSPTNGRVNHPLVYENCQKKGKGFSARSAFFLDCSSPSCSINKNVQALTWRSALSPPFESQLNPSNIHQACIAVGIEKNFNVKPDSAAPLVVKQAWTTHTNTEFRLLAYTIACSSEKKRPYILRWHDAIVRLVSI